MLPPGKAVRMAVLLPIRTIRPLFFISWGMRLSRIRFGNYLYEPRRQDHADRKETSPRQAVVLPLVMSGCRTDRRLPLPWHYFPLARHPPQKRRAPSESAATSVDRFPW